MAEDITKKQLKWVQKSVQLASQLDALLDDAESHAAQYSFMGNLETADIWTNGDIQHTIASDMLTFVSRLSDLCAWFATDYRRDIIRKTML